MFKEETISLSAPENKTFVMHARNVYVTASDYSKAEELRIKLGLNENRGSITRRASGRVGPGHRAAA